MTSLRQIVANRRNASKSTGPRTEQGKLRSRANAVRHGLSAETVIGALEDAEDYKAFEAAIIADYDAQSAVERELVLRLASLLWRLSRATGIEAGLFEIQAEHLSDLIMKRQFAPPPQQTMCPIFSQPSPQPYEEAPASFVTGELEMAHPSNKPTSGLAANPSVDLARCFLQLANLPNCALDRLGRYEAALWRQVGQTLVTLDALDRRKPQERGGLFRTVARQQRAPRAIAKLNTACTSWISGFANAVFNSRFNTSIAEIRAGLNYKFDWFASRI